MFFESLLKERDIIDIQVIRISNKRFSFVVRKWQETVREAGNIQLPQTSSWWKVEYIYNVVALT